MVSLSSRVREAFEVMTALCRAGPNAQRRGHGVPARTRWMRRQRRRRRRVWHNLRQKLRGQIGWRDLALTSRLPSALLRRLNREQGVTLVLVTHDAEAAGFADRVVHLRDGRIVTEETA